MSDIDVFGIGMETALPELYAQCVASLCDHSRIVIFTYPEQLRTALSTDAEWSSKSLFIRELNEQSLLARAVNSVNCYAVHTRKHGDDWVLRYIGQTDCKRAKSAILRRLVPHGERDNAVFTKCKNAVRSGHEIGLRLIKVEPDTLRFFVQEKLVNERRTAQVLDWNHQRMSAFPRRGD